MSVRPTELLYQYLLSPSRHYFIVQFSKNRILHVGAFKSFCFSLCIVYDGFLGVVDIVFFFFGRVCFFFLVHSLCWFLVCY